MKEKEYWGVISKEIFEQKLAEFSEKFGTPNIKKRLSLEISDWQRPHVDNRIKITKGHAVFVHKVGDWNTKEREEHEVEITPEVENILSFYKILFTLIDPKDSLASIMQHENYLFDTKFFEIKLSHQTGKSDKYTFEVELKDTTQNLDQICLELGLNPDNEPKDRAFWDQWNLEINFQAGELNDKELKALISNYLGI